MRPVLSDGSQAPARGVEFASYAKTSSVGTIRIESLGKKMPVQIKPVARDA